MTCPAEGSRSLLALCHAADLADGPDEPVMAHLTCCPKHLASVRGWLRTKAEDGQVITVGTTKLLARWGQIIDPLEMPVWGAALAHA